MKQIVWIGKWQEVFDGFKIDGSITEYGTASEYHFVYEKHGCQKSFEEFVADKCTFFLNIMPEVVFYFYDQSLAYQLKRVIPLEHCICLNAQEILNWLNNKSIARCWFENDMNIPGTIVLSAAEISYDNLKNYFLGYDKFVIQKMISSGGKGTYLATENDMPLLDNDELFIVSPYYQHSLSVNVTTIVSSDKIAIFPVSVQNIVNHNNMLLYMGSDFIAANILDKTILKQLKCNSLSISKRIQFMGYRGICGIDFLIHNDEVFFLEINPRFQGSSFLINKKLLQKHSVSLFKLNFDAFYTKINDNTQSQIEEIIIDLAFYKDNNKHRCLSEQSYVKIDYEYNSNEYYDFFAEKYHLMLNGYEEKIKTQGKILQSIIQKYSHIDVKHILDCTCGIGIQAISLAQEGYEVTGSDISKNELNCARRESAKRGVHVNYLYADCRFLEQYTNKEYDTIISIDSALPHLLTYDNFLLAFKSIYQRLKKGGVFLSSYRDYCELLKTKPNMAYPIRFNSENDIEYTIFRKWKWNDNIIHSKQYVIEDSKAGNKLYTKEYKQWAITKTELFALAADSGFAEHYWLVPSDSGFSQPILCLIK